MNFIVILVVLLIAIFDIIHGQDCGTLGQQCLDQKQCCGGCCIGGICIQTYRNCQIIEYPCIDEYCPPGFECYMFEPSPYCLGCGIQKACRPFKDPGPGKY